MAEIRSGRDGRDWTTLPNRGTAVTAGPPYRAGQLSTDNGPARGGGRDSEHFENTSIYGSSADTRVWQNMHTPQVSSRPQSDQLFSAPMVPRQVSE